MKKTTIVALIFVALISKGQSAEIGQWKDYLPYNNSISLAKMNGKIYVATENNLFFWDESDEILGRLTKVNGLSDVGINAMEKDPQQDVLLVAYKSSKIDIIENNNIYSILDVERENIVGGKSINNITFNNKTAYLSTSFGIIEVNIKRKEIANTFYLNSNANLNVNDICFLGDSIFAATNLGLYRANLNDNLSDYRSWKSPTNSIPIVQIETAYNSIYFITEQGDSIYSYNLTDVESIGSVPNIKCIKTSKNRLFVGAQSKLIEISQNNTLNTIKENSYFFRISDIIVDEPNYWISDGIRGLVKLDQNLRLKHYIPSGPLSSHAFSVAVGQNNTFISTGGISVIWDNNNTYQGLNWTDGYSWYNIPYTDLGNARDLTTIVEAPNKHIFVGTWNNGVLELVYDEQINNYKLIKQHNYQTSSGGLETIEIDTSLAGHGWIRVKGLSFDEKGNLWLSNSLVQKGLAYMNPNGQWQSLNVNSYATNNSHLGDLIIDQQGKKWFYIAKGGGIIVYDDNGTVENSNDDRDRRLTTSPGSGGLPSNRIFSMAMDRDGEIWVGTDKGVAVFYDTDRVFGIDGDAQLVLVEVDGYVEPIIANESVRAIAIDGANRKWFGTQSGVFVYSADGSEQIAHYTEENSPLFSNVINDISINQQSGEVFIATDKGLISYKGGATQGRKVHDNVIVYPNPVKESYNGPIAIKNVVENANVKITDVKGNLIQSFTALGGQAVWNGKNKYGERANTGVYLVFTTDPTGIETNVAKILFIK